jgi:hypothetical protein
MERGRAVAGSVRRELALGKHRTAGKSAVGHTRSSREEERLRGSSNARSGYSEGDVKDKKAVSSVRRAGKTTGKTSGTVRAAGKVEEGAANAREPLRVVDL